ncbi:MAG: M48 family metallopeptidase [Pseudomonadota bacterium]
MSGKYTSGKFFDGQTATPHEVAVEITPTQIRIAKGSEAIIWPMENVKALSDQARRQGIVLECIDSGEERLVLPDDTIADHLKETVPALFKRRVSGKMKRRVMIWGGGAVASVCLILFVIIPLLANTLATFIPVQREVAMGNFTIKQIENVFVSAKKDQPKTCTTPQGQAALDKMIDRLTPHFENPYPPSVRVMRSPLVNAFAVPGGHVVLFEGLLKDAESPEEVAGVLAHEYGHVVNRDPTRLGLRTAGSAGILGLVFGDFAGGFAALALAEAMMNADYSQEAEMEADQFSHEVFARAGLPSSRLADFFARLEAEHGDVEGLLSYIATHPELKGREAAANAADVIQGADFEPVLTSLEFAALKRICTDDKRVIEEDET